jgi:hypothetical protein
VGRRYPVKRWLASHDERTKVAAELVLKATWKLFTATPQTRIYRDLWIVTLTDDGRGSALEEWPVT